MLVTTLICCSFQGQEDDDFELLKLCTSPKKLSRKPTKWHSFGGRSGKLNKNPYADRGLDKYSALLAELDSERQKIYTQKGSEDISLLGFVYSDSVHYKPIVVRLRDKKHQPKKIDNIAPEASLEKSLIEQPKLVDQVKVMSRIVSGIKTTPNNISFSKLKKNLRQPSYYLPVIIILILIFWALFGRSFAILSTTLGWYFIPTIQTSSPKKSLKKTKTTKKDYGKAMSHNDSMISDQNTKKTKKTKTMKKAMSYNVKSINTIDHGLSSPKSVVSGYKSPPQGSPPKQEVLGQN